MFFLWIESLLLIPCQNFNKLFCHNLIATLFLLEDDIPDLKTKHPKTSWLSVSEFLYLFILLFSLLLSFAQHWFHLRFLLEITWLKSILSVKLVHHPPPLLLLLISDHLELLVVILRLGIFELLWLTNITKSHRPFLLTALLKLNFLHLLLMLFSLLGLEICWDLCCLRHWILKSIHPELLIWRCILFLDFFWVLRPELRYAISSFFIRVKNSVLIWSSIFQVWSVLKLFWWLPFHLFLREVEIRFRNWTWVPKYILFFDVRSLIFLLSINILIFPLLHFLPKYRHLILYLVLLSLVIDSNIILIFNIIKAQILA